MMKDYINDEEEDSNENGIQNNFTEKENTKDIDNYLYLNEKSNSTNNKMISNTKIVEWSDGTMQLLIGNEYFDINLSNIDNSRYAIYDKEKHLF